MQNTPLEILNEAIDAFRQAVELSSNDSVTRSYYLVNLGKSLFERFDYTGNLQDIEDSIYHLQEALQLVSSDSPEKLIALEYLARNYYEKFSHSGNLTDIDQAVQLYRLAIQESPSDSQKRSHLLNGLGISLQERYHFENKIPPTKNAAELIIGEESKDPGNDQIQSDYVRVIGHQLIAPLTGIQGHAENIFRWLNSWKEDAVIEQDILDIRIKQQRFNRAIDSIQSIMWMTSSTSRQIRNYVWFIDTTNPSDIPSKEAIHDMASFLFGCTREFGELAKMNGLRGIRIDASVKKLDGKAKVNEALFSQAIKNLLDNAIKYSYKDTEIVIDGKIEKKRGLINITNIGIPIQDYEVDMIFEQGFRTSAARGKHVTGAGIGLSVSKKIVELNGGNIAVKSKLVESNREIAQFLTTFSVSLPIA